jgi:hypothetical protein
MCRRRESEREFAQSADVRTQRDARDAVVCEYYSLRKATFKIACRNGVRAVVALCGDDESRFRDARHDVIRHARLQHFDTSSHRCSDEKSQDEPRAYLTVSVPVMPMWMVQAKE